MPESHAKPAQQTYLAEHYGLLFEFVRWVPVSVAVGVMAGVASAVLLWSLNLATVTREAHPWLIVLLAPAGLAIGLLYKFFGASVEAGNNLILEEAHDPRTTIPARMAPLILFATFVSHLFGASVGREGTALQTGASLADQLSRPLRMSPRDRRILLMAGIAAGFGSVFGTPLAGAVFGIEVLAIGKLSYDAIAPCFLASFVGDLVAHAMLERVWRLHHTLYPVSGVPPLNVMRLLCAVFAGIVFGLAAGAFSRTTHAVAKLARKRIAFAPLRPFAGGIVVTVLVFGIGYAHMAKYLGLGIPTIVGAFNTQLQPWDFAVKLLLTAFCIGVSFKGGEVTPLFFMGAALGNALSLFLPLPPSLLAAMGFAAVFAGAANTPIASTLMAAELFGAEAGAYAGIACVMAYLFSGHAGIYGAQRVGLSKHQARTGDEGLSLALVAKQQAEEETIQPS